MQSDVDKIVAIPHGHIVEVHFNSGQISVGYRMPNCAYLKIEYLVQGNWLDARETPVQCMTIYDMGPGEVIDVIDHGEANEELMPF